MRLFCPGIIFRLLYPGSVIRINSINKDICLTFDDGPDPSSTPRLLKILGKYNIHAIFFCSGQNAVDNPALVSLIKDHGHIVGNHGYSHMDGWRTSFDDYSDDCKRSAEVLPGRLFRPPYGRMTRRQFSALKKHFRIFLWSFMAYDFDLSFTPERSLKALKRNISPGSVIVLHDTINSSANTIIEDFIQYTIKSGYSFILPDTEGNFYSA
jgi:peptidoglycan-N-acetylglucosamine deacetylase